MATLQHSTAIRRKPTVDPLWESSDWGSSIESGESALVDYILAELVQTGGDTITNVSTRFSGKI